MNKYLKNTSLSLFIILALSNITFGQDFFFGNNKPIADAGKDIKTRPGETIFLDGSRSNVGDGSKIKYHWTFAPGLVLKSENNFASTVIKISGLIFLIFFISLFNTIFNFKKFNIISEIPK